MYLTGPLVGQIESVKILSVDRLLLQINRLRVIGSAVCLLQVTCISNILVSACSSQAMLESMALFSQDVFLWRFVLVAEVGRAGTQPH